MLITDFMIANRGPDRGSMMCGKSTHNHELFSFMEYEQILNVFNEINLTALHYVFLQVCDNSMTSLMAGDRHGPNTLCEQ